ncbi:MAG: J domain-containing protein [Cytophagaceae bacterium]
MPFTLYQILGVHSTATAEEIKAAYKKLAKQFHPDKHQGSLFHEEQFKAINQAYQTLSDPEKRKRYDLILSYNINYNKATPPERKRKNRSEASSQYRRAQPPIPDFKFSKSDIKGYAIAAGLFVVFVIAITSFYFYMNNRMAIQAYEEGIQLENKGMDEDALEKYFNALEYKEEFVPAYIRSAQIYIRHSDFRSALYFLNRADYFSEYKNWEIKYLKAKAFMKTKNYSVAAEVFSQTLALNPSCDSAYLFRGDIYNFYTYQPALAYKDYNSFLQAQPDSPQARFGKSLALYNKAEFEKALMSYDSLIQRYPEEGKYYYYRAVNKLALKDTSEACIDFKISESLGFEKAQKTTRFCKPKN